MSETLRPCPFCGELPQVRDQKVMHACRVLDKEIRTSVPAWNRRAERTCSFPVTKDEEEIARRDASAAPGTFVTQDVPLCRKCTSCGNKFKPWAEAPKWLRYCPQCGARVVSK